jgi:hypothetical protein
MPYMSQASVEIPWDRATTLAVFVVSYSLDVLAFLLQSQLDIEELPAALERASIPLYDVRLNMKPLMVLLSRTAVTSHERSRSSRRAGSTGAP